MHCFVRLNSMYLLVAGWCTGFRFFFLLSDSYTSCLYCNIVPVFSCLLDSNNRPGKREQPSMCLVQGLEKILLSLKR